MTAWEEFPVRMFGITPHRNRFSASLLQGLLVLLALFMVSAAFGSDKKGAAIGRAFDPDGTRLAALKVGWYYNWTMKPNSEGTASCFVPMYWGKRGQLEDITKELRNPHSVILTFNEPDFAKQSNRTIDETLAEWPQVAKLADRVSAPTAGRPFDAWMQEFMKQAGSRRLKMDFLPVHWYGAPDSKRFLQFIDKLYAQYRKPLWITEFAVADWHSSKYKTENRFDEAEVIRFIREVLPELEKRTYVERYSWLVAETDKESLRPSLLFDDAGKLTTVGRAYADFKSGGGKRCADPAVR